MTHEEEIYAAAVLAPAATRDALVTRACGGDEALRVRVEALLRGNDEADAFFGAPLIVRPAAPAEERPGDRIGRYKLRQQIGEGGCGVVYLAEQEEPVRRRVALKVIKIGMDTKEVIARFEAERQALALMEHPNIARVLEAGATGTGRPFFVMELVGGIPITRYCDEENLSTGERLRLFVQVCHAVQHAHQKGIIHRDLKPSNILVGVQDGVVTPKVIDFGIAKATQGRLTDQTVFTAFEQFIGTPAYMSPEQTQLGGLDVDTRSDIYSLGVLLYELLVGRPPFDPNTLAQSGIDEIRRIVRDVEPPRPSTRFATLSEPDRLAVARHRGTGPAQISTLVRGDLDWIVMKALEKDRARRYETANGLASDVKRHLVNEPVVARPPGTAYRFQKLIARHKFACGAGAAVLISLFAGATVSAILYLRERAAHERAVEAEHSQIIFRKQAELARSNEARLRLQAESGEKRAATEAARSAQVAQYLKGVLASVGPRVALGRTSVREILDQAEKRLNVELQNQDSIVAELRETLGTLYTDLGEYARAEEMHRQALATRRRLFGNDHAEVASSLHNLAITLDFLARRNEAEVLLGEALAIRKRLFGDVHAAVAETEHMLSVVISRQRRYDEAELLGRRALAARRQLFGAEHVAVAESLYDLAAIVERQNRWAEAEAMYRESLRLRRNLLGPDHLDVARTLSNLGLIVGRQGPQRWAEGLELAREAVVICRRVLAHDHPITGLCLMRYGSILLHSDRQAEALPVLREAVAIGRKRGEHNDTSNAITTLARALLRQNSDDVEAESLAREAAAMDLRLVGKGSPPNGTAMALLKQLLAQRGRQTEAAAIEQAMVDEMKRSVGALAQPTLRAMANLAWSCRLDAKPAAGIPLAEQAVAGFRVTRGVHDRSTIEAMDTLAWLQHDAGIIKESVALFIEILQAAREAFGPDDSSIPNYMANLATAYRDAGRLEEARTLLQETILMGKKKFGSDNGSVATNLRELADVYLRENNAVAAESAAREAVAIDDKRFPRSVTQGANKCMLASALAAQKRYSEAEPLFISGADMIRRQHASLRPSDARWLQQQVVDPIVAFYDAVGTPEKAAEWQRTLPLNARTATATVKELSR